MSRTEPRPGQEGYWSDLAEQHGRDADGSRLSKTNRADSKSGGQSRPAHRSRKLPLTERDGVTLRQELQDFDDLQGDRPVSWSRTVNRYQQYIEDKRDVEAIFEGPGGQRARGSDPHRFAPEYADKQYAKLKDLERGISDEYGKRLHTAMLTFTGSASPDGEQIPPADHLDALLGSWEAVRRALDRALDGRRYERLAILEPHGGGGTNHGYLHIHMAVFVDGSITRDDLAPVIDAHLRNCDIARKEAHEVTDQSVISIRHAGADRDLDDDDQLDELAIYLAEYLGTYGDDPLEQAEHVQAANALLWATGRQRWRPSNGAQQYMAHDPPETAGEWRLVGIEKDDEVLPCDGSSGGVDTFTTATRTRPPPN